MNHEPHIYKSYIGSIGLLDPNHLLLQTSIIIIFFNLFKNLGYMLSRKEHICYMVERGEQVKWGDHQLAGRPFPCGHPSWCIKIPTKD